MSKLYNVAVNNFLDIFNGDNDMDILERDIENLGYNSNDYDLELIEAIQDQLGLNLEEAVQASDDYFYGYFDTVRDFIYDLVDQTMVIPDHLQFYIDFAKIERDYMMDYSIVQTSKGLAIIANH